jgi:hypothetical protein
MHNCARKTQRRRKKMEDEKREDDEMEDEKTEYRYSPSQKERLEHLRKELETVNQRIEVLEITEEKLRLDNPLLIKALDNDLFLKIIYEIVNLSYGLHLNDKKDKDPSQIMTDMVRFEYITEKGEESIIWVYFPKNSKSKSIHCRLQKHGYSSKKVKQPKPSDNRAYPYINVHNEKDIKDLISCISEYMNKGMGVNPLNIT